MTLVVRPLSAFATLFWPWFGLVDHRSAWRRSDGRPFVSPGRFSAVRLIAEHVPDIVLMDLVMVGIGGVEATRQVKRVSPHTQVIVLTSYDDDEYIFPALRAGALSYMLKDVGINELAETIRKAARGESVLHPRVAARVVQEMHHEYREIPASSRNSALAS